MTGLSVAESTMQYPGGATATMVAGAGINSKLDELAAQRGGGTYQMDTSTQRLAEARGAGADRVLDQMTQRNMAAAQNQAMEALRGMGIGGSQPDRAPTATPSAPAQGAGHKPGHAPVNSHVAALASKVDLSGVQKAAQGQGTHAQAVTASKGSRGNER